MADYPALYAGIRERISAVVEAVGDDVIARPVPTCPEWTTKDVVAHLAGIVTDVRNGNVAGAGTDPWTAVQVADRRARTLKEVLAEWAEGAPEFEAALASFPEPVVRQVIADAVSHEHDVRLAVGAPGARDSEAVSVGLGFFAATLARRITEAGLAPLRVQAGTSEYLAGDGAPTVTLTTPDEFEALRALSARRSAAQVRALAWDGDPEAHLAVLTPFPMAANPIIE